MTEGNAIQLLVFMILPLALMAMAYTFKRGALMWGAVPAWLVFGLNNYAFSAGGWDLYYGLFLSSFGLILLCVVEAVLIKPKKQDVKEDMYVEDLDRQAGMGEKGDKETPEEARKRRRAARQPKGYFH